MTDDNSESRILAHWHFTNEQWREYLYYEKLESDHNTFADVRKILSIGIATLVVIAIIGAANGGLAVFFFVLIAGSLFFGLCYLIHGLVRINAEQRLNTQTGEVKITNFEVDINGVIFDWRINWNPPQILKEYIHIGEEKLLLLNFKCTGWVNVNSSRVPVEKKTLVPVQLGKEEEADNVILEITKK